MNIMKELKKRIGNEITTEVDYLKMFKQGDIRFKDIPVENQTEEICKIAVEQDENSLRYVKNQTEEICKIAVEQDGEVLDFVQNPTEEICKLAVAQDGNALRFVKNQTKEICKIAVDQDENATDFVNKAMLKPLLELMEQEVTKS